MKLKKYNLEGKELEDVLIDDALLMASIHHQLVKDYIVAIQKNRRQWSANTKGRSEIALSNKKPHPQKGTGRARQGCIKTAQYRKGAVVFGPKPKFDQHVRINRKERRAAIRYLLAEKVSKGNVRFLKIESFEKPKTKRAFDFLEAVGLKNKKTLFLCNQQENGKMDRIHFYLSMRNIPKTEFLPIQNINAYDLMKIQEIVVIDTAQEKLIEAMGGQSE